MKLQDSFGRKIRQLGRSPKTAKAYWYRIDQFIRWLYKKNGQWVHPKDVGKPEITDWLSHLANDQHVSPRTQNVALQALLFLYKQVLGIQIEGVNAIRAKAPKITIKDILSREEIAQLFAAMGDSTTRFCAQMLYGCGLRRGDLLQLRIKDLHFDRNQISIKDTKHGHQHWTMFPRSLHDTVRVCQQELSL